MPIKRAVAMQNYMDVDSRPGEKEMSYISTSENGKWTEYEFRSRGDETTHMWPVGVVRLA